MPQGDISRDTIYIMCSKIKVFHWWLAWGMNATRLFRIPQFVQETAALRGSWWWSFCCNQLGAGLSGHQSSFFLHQVVPHWIHRVHMYVYHTYCISSNPHVLLYSYIYIWEYMACDLCVFPCFIILHVSSINVSYHMHIVWHLSLLCIIFHIMSSPWWSFTYIYIIICVYVYAMILRCIIHFPYNYIYRYL